MANLTEVAQWETGIYRLETTDDVLGGESGTSNVQAKLLGNRTLFLRKTYDGLLSKSIAGGSAVVLTEDEAANGIIVLSGVITADITVDVPGIGKWIFENQTTGDYTVTVQYAGVGVALRQSSRHHLFCDGVSVRAAGLHESKLEEIAAQKAAALAISNWTERTNPKNFALNGVAVNSAGLWVAVGAADGTDAYIVSSVDGESWTERTNPKNFALNGIAVNPNTGKFVAVGAADGTDAYIVASTDGSTWTEKTNPKNVTLNAVMWSSITGFVAVGNADGGDAYMLHSSDGDTWTEIANPKNFALRAVSATATGAVAVGDYDGTDAYVLTCTNNPATWSERTNPATGALAAVKYVSWLGAVIAVGADGEFISTTNGATWEAEGLVGSGLTSSAMPTDLKALTASDAIVVAVGAATTNRARMISTVDGETWINRKNPKSFALNAIACSYVGATGESPMFVAVGGADGTDAYIVTSLRM
jgi:hypothetical protein